jgi:capsular polysaccharide biosynthesis protein
MEFKQLLTLLKHWYWVLFLGLLAGVVSGYLISRIQDPVYEATTKVLIMHASQQSTSSFAYLTDQQLTQTFGQLITIQPVLDAVSNKLGIKVYSTQIQVQPVLDTQIVKVIVDDKNPQRTAKIANALVEETIQRFEGLQVGQSTSSEAEIKAKIVAVEGQMASVQSEITLISGSIIKTQMEQIQSQMTPLQTEVSSLQKEIALITPASTSDQNSAIAEKQARLNQIQPLLTAYQLAYSNLVVLKKPMDLGSADENKLTLLQKTLALYQQNYIDLTSQLQSVRQSQSQNISNVMQIETASVPVTPVRPRILINVLLAGAVGLVLAVIVIFLLENPDEYLKIRLNNLGFLKPLRSKEDTQEASSL